jgi:hypothetical protein
MSSRLWPLASNPSSRDTGKRRSRMQGFPVQTSGRVVIRAKVMATGVVYPETRRVTRGAHRPPRENVLAPAGRRAYPACAPLMRPSPTARLPRIVTRRVASCHQDRNHALSSPPVMPHHSVLPRHAEPFDLPHVASPRVSTTPASQAGRRRFDSGRPLQRRRGAAEYLQPRVSFDAAHVRTYTPNFAHATHGIRCRRTRWAAPSSWDIRFESGRRRLDCRLVDDGAWCRDFAARTLFRSLSLRLSWARASAGQSGSFKERPASARPNR